MSRNGPLSTSGRTAFFIRDDDVGDLTDGLKAFVETFVALKAPVSYQIIPARLTPACATYLLSVAQANPGLVEFGQHGLHHRMTVGGRELKREFGPERSLSEQSAIIAEGLALMQRSLGRDAQIRVFTPPQHKFDGNTVRAAAAAGHRVFSAACYPSLRHQLAYSFGRGLRLSSFRHQGISYHGRLRPEATVREISIAIDVDDGKRRKRSGPEVEGALRDLEGRATPVGLMLHHDLYADAAGRAQLADIAAAVARHGRERFRLLGDLAGAPSTGEAGA